MEIPSISEHAVADRSDGTKPKSDSMVNGSVTDIVKAFPGLDRFALVSFLFKAFCHHIHDPLAGGDARGPIYIHNQGMIHGSLKGVRL